MLWRPRHIARNSLISVYAGAFFLSLHAAITTYVDSSFLGKKFHENGVGLIFTVSSFLTIVLLMFAPRILRHIGNYAAAIIFSLLEALSLVGLVFFPGAATIGAIFIFHTAISTLLFFNFDVFTENQSVDETTGNTRGIFLLSLNLAYVFGASLVGMFLEGTEEYWRIYLLSAAVMLPVMLIVFSYLKDFHDPMYRETSLKKALLSAWKNRDISLITFANFLLQFFYAIMIIYTPMYLNQHLGFSWGEIGSIFSIMLLPFVFFQLPLGRLADERIGEQEILTAGFLLISITTFAVSFLAEHSIILWAALLFMTRVGAAAIEVMTETYFFKKIDASDAGLLSVFRYTKPVAYIIAPIAATFFLFAFPLQYIFLALGIFLLTGVPATLMLKDTK